MNQYDFDQLTDAQKWELYSLTADRLQELVNQIRRLKSVMGSDASNELKILERMVN